MEPTQEISETAEESVADYTPGLNRIRIRRKIFFGVIIAYVPVMWLIHSIAPDNRTMFSAFGVWVVLLLVTCFTSAIVRCPRCGNLFHVNGMAMLYLRKCLHCQLHVNADRLK